MAALNAAFFFLEVCEVLERVEREGHGGVVDDELDEGKHRVYNGGDEDSEVIGAESVYFERDIPRGIYEVLIGEDIASRGGEVESLHDLGEEDNDVGEQRNEEGE